MPFFLEPGYDEDFTETNQQRMLRKWGGSEGWARVKKQHRLDERGAEA